jgi:hypothetical protein
MTTPLDRGARIENGRVTGIRKALQSLLDEKTAELATLASTITILQLQIDEMPDTVDLTDLPGLSMERSSKWEQ